MRSLFGVRARRAAVLVTAVAALAQLLVVPVAAVDIGPVSTNLATSSYLQKGKPTLSITTRCDDRIATTGQAGLAGNRKYFDGYYSNGSTSDVCVTVNFSADKNVNIAAYEENYSPNSPASSLLAGMKTSTTSCSGKSGTFGFLLPAQTHFHIVVSECTPGSGGTVFYNMHWENAVAGTDARIKKGTGTLVGNGVYNEDATGQTVGGSVAVGSSITFTISVENESNYWERFRVSPSGTAVSGFAIKYFHGTTDITTAVANNLFVTPYLPPGGTYAIKAKVKVNAGTKGASIGRYVFVVPMRAQLVDDTVRFTVTRK